LTREVPERALTATELEVLTELLGMEFTGAQDLRSQLPHATVVGRCECGCATVDLHVDPQGAPPAPASKSPIPAEARVTDDRGGEIGGILVFLDHGYLSSLEIYSAADPIAAWPDAAHRHLMVVSR
jgi:hypothetical protein